MDYLAWLEVFLYSGAEFFLIPTSYLSCNYRIIYMQCKLFGDINKDSVIGIREEYSKEMAI